MSYHWSKGTTVYTSSRFAQIFWWTIKNKRERSPEKEAAALNTGRPLRRLRYRFPQICHCFIHWLPGGSRRYHLNASAWTGKVCFWNKTITTSLPGELFMPLKVLSLFTCCWAQPFLCHHSHPGLFLPLLQDSRELSFDKTQKGESFPMKHQFLFLKEIKSLEN